MGGGRELRKRDPVRPTRAGHAGHAGPLMRGLGRLRGGPLLCVVACFGQVSPLWLIPSAWDVPLVPFFPRRLIRTSYSVTCAVQKPASVQFGSRQRGCSWSSTSSWKRTRTCAPSSPFSIASIPEEMRRSGAEVHLPWLLGVACNATSSSCLHRSSRGSLPWAHCTELQAFTASRFVTVAYHSQQMLSGIATSIPYRAESLSLHYLSICLAWHHPENKIE